MILCDVYIIYVLLYVSHTLFMSYFGTYKPIQMYKKFFII